MHRLTHTFVIVAALATAAVFAAGALAGSGNSPTAKLCQKEGWKWAVDSSGGAFANADDCVAYGVLRPPRRAARTGNPAGETGYSTHPLPT